MNMFRKWAAAAGLAAPGAPPTREDRPDARPGKEPETGGLEEMHSSWTGLQRGRRQDEDDFEGEGWTFWGL